MNSIQPLNRIAIELGPLTVYWYGLIIASGAILGLAFVLKDARRTGIDKDLFIDLILYAVPISILSARIYYVLFSWDYYKENLGDIIAIWEGGIAIHGALIGAVLTAVVFARKRKVSFWKIADVAAPGILIGQAIGRWGNFMNQEAHGGEVSRTFLEGLGLPTWIVNQMLIDGTYYHPTFLYESIWNIVGMIVLLLIRNRVGLRRGELFLSYVIWYSFGRFFIEGMRTDSLMLTSSIRMAQAISIVLIIGSFFFIYYRRKYVKPLPVYGD
ncbi:prolipoprotein diacylglyceryl transferase (plasmid) [Alkalihalobacillus hwajinpoensis]|uniref:prolipoprotein diacylglyceryl transferase n=1 Tax=Guptibacillus hwajinpoensis TaxID=208199 RepID=UPI0018834023|nr:prolipoprotein diacylglyceryl transferase [Pseudalkalibacillus hwajinpoensis]MBF0706559.1 prolipoprotein diacylglyceryl transferase [Pseudalkalibacillus hwajinpoensis]